MTLLWQQREKSNNVIDFVLIMFLPWLTYKECFNFQDGKTPCIGTCKLSLMAYLTSASRVLVNVNSLYLEKIRNQRRLKHRQKRHQTKSLASQRHNSVGLLIWATTLGDFKSDWINTLSRNFHCQFAITTFLFSARDLHTHCTEVGQLRGSLDKEHRQVHHLSLRGFVAEWSKIWYRMS